MKEIEDEGKVTVSSLINLVDKSEQFEGNWRRKCNENYQTYYGDLTVSNQTQSGVTTEKFNISNANYFYSIIETLKSGVLPKIPSAVCNVAPEINHPIVNASSSVLEKVVNRFVISPENENEFTKFKQELFICGRALLWPQIEVESIEEVKQQKNESLEEPKLPNINISLKSFSYSDYFVSPAKNVADIWWVCTRQLLWKEEIEKIFGKEVTSETENHAEVIERDEASSYVSKDRIYLYEFWDKRKNKVYRFIKTYSEILSEVEPPIKYKNFFPATPLYFLDTTSTLPVSELQVYEEELDYVIVTSQRINGIVTAIKPIMFYNQSFIQNIPEVERNPSLKSGISLIPILLQKNFQGTQQIQDMLYQMPLQDLGQMVQFLMQYKESLKESIYQITGVSDIMQNAAAEYESATATSQKTQFGSLRLQKRQQRINEYLRKTYESVSSLICGYFTSDFLSKFGTTDLYDYKITMTDENGQIREIPMDYKIIEDYLTKSGISEMRMDAETSLDIWSNNQINSETKFKLIDSVGQIMQQMKESINPKTAKLMLELYGYTIDSMIPDRTQKSEIMQTLGSLVSDMEQASKNMDNNAPPNPDLIIAQAEMEKSKAEQLKAQAAIKQSQVKEQELLLKAKELELEEKKMMLEMQRKEAEVMLRTNEAQSNEQINVARVNVEAIKARQTPKNIN